MPDSQVSEMGVTSNMFFGFAEGKDSENSPFFLVCILGTISKSLQTLQGFGEGGGVV